MPLNRRRALGLLTVVLGACASGDNSSGLSTGFSSGMGTTGDTDTATGETDTGGETDTYGTDGGGMGEGDGGYFEQTGTVGDVDLDH